MDLADVLFGLVIVLAVASALAFLRRSVKKQGRLNRVWREFAAIKGLKEQPVTSEAMLRFHGENSGMPFVLECIMTEGTPVRVGTLKMSYGEDPKLFSRMAVRLPESPRGLRLYRETAWSKLGKAVGMQDITTGDPEFDRMFLVKGSDPEAVRAFLSPFRRMTLLSHAAKLDGLELEDGQIVLVRPNQIDDIEELDGLFSRVGTLAVDLARA